MPRVPLFPLNLVLFPGQNLPLHIFEQRYKDMLQRCLQNQEPFGSEATAAARARFPRAMSSSSAGVPSSSRSSA